MSLCEQTSVKQTSEVFKNLGKNFVNIEQAPDLIDGFIPGAFVLISSIKNFMTKPNSRDKLNEILNRKIGFENTIDTNKIQFQFAQIISEITKISSLVKSIDLHWSDDESLDLPCYLDRQLKGCILLIICSYRRNDLIAGTRKGILLFL